MSGAALQALVYDCGGQRVLVAKGRDSLGIYEVQGFLPRGPSRPIRSLPLRAGRRQAEGRAMDNQGTL